MDHNLTVRCANYASSSHWEDTISSLGFQTSSTSNKCPVLEVKSEDCHRELAKLEYTHNFSIKEKMNYRSLQDCDHCSYRSKSIFFMLNHVRRHRLPSQLFDCATSNVELYHCKDCDVDFDSVTHLRNHIKENHSTNQKIEDYALKSFICLTCSFATCSALQSLKHVKAGCLEVDISSNANILKTDQKPTDNKMKKWFYCEKCTFKTAYKSSLNKHLTVMHTDDNDKKWFHCNKCTYKSTDKCNLNKHIMGRHTDNRDKRWFQCEKCTFKTEHKSSLNMHIMAKHTDEKNKKWFYCEKCAFKTTYTSSLHSHFRLKHTDDNDKKWFRCDKCTYKSTRKSNLNKHIMGRHTDNRDKRWFQCEKCPFKTTHNSSITKHMVKHSDDKDKKWFYCEKCRFRTIHKRYLNHHIMIKHADGKNEKCFHCEKCKYIQSSIQTSFQLSCFVKT